MLRQEEHALGETGDLVTHPRTDDDERGDHREHARQVRQRRILDLRSRLNRGDDEPDDRRDAHDGKRDEGREDERLLRGVDERAVHSLAASPESSPESSAVASLLESCEEESVAASVVPVSDVPPESVGIAASSLIVVLLV